jgi:hypothetical protein
MGTVNKGGAMDKDAAKEIAGAIRDLGWAAIICVVIWALCK